MNLGDLGIDFSMARPSHGTMGLSGAQFAIRYSAGAASNPAHPSHPMVAPKLVTPAEFRQLLADGFDVVANDEWYESRVTEGASAGALDGAAAHALWSACGLAKGASIYVSWDQAPNPAKWPAVEAYLLAFDKALQGDYHVDMYGGTPILKHLLAKGIIRYGWRPNAGSWSGDNLPYQPDTSTPAKRAALATQAQAATPAHIWQTGNYWFGQSADENLIVRTPVGSHKEALNVTAPKPSPHPAPSPAPSDLPTTGEWSVRWTNPDTGVRRSAAGWMLQAIKLLLQISHDTAAIRRKLGA